MQPCLFRKPKFQQFCAKVVMIMNSVMQESQSAREQIHPLYSIDRESVDRLLVVDTPKEADLVELARLFIRYEGFPGAIDLSEDMMKILNQWGLTRDQLNLETRRIWEKGFRPGKQVDDSLGSGFDTSDKQ